MDNKREETREEALLKELQKITLREIDSVHKDIEKEIIDNGHLDHVVRAVESVILRKLSAKENEEATVERRPKKRNTLSH